MSLLDLHHEPFYEPNLQRYVDPTKRLEVVSMDYCRTRQKYKRAWDRRNRQYVCISQRCGLVWHGRGNRNSAKKHAEISGHTIIKGNPEGKYRMMEWEK